VGERIGALDATGERPLDVEISLESGPAVLWDGVIVPDAGHGGGVLPDDAQAQEFVRLQYRHGKPLLALGSGAELLKAAKIPRKLPHSSVPDPGVIVAEPAEAAEALMRFKSVLAQHRIYARETAPPRV
jgi:catalase